MRHFSVLMMASATFAAIGTAPVRASDAPATSATAPVADASASPGTQATYPAGFFSAFSPKSALDMLRNLPGFQIREGDSNTRGLGKATENVLVNGQRLSGKSDGLYDQLGRIPASNVVRIEIIDGAHLSIPGLSGQVANIVTGGNSFSGQFGWNGEVRPHFSHPGYLGGEVSVTGTRGRVEYTLGLSNDEGRGAYGGPYSIRDADGAVIEARDGRLWSDNDDPKVSAGFKYRGPGSTVGNLNLSYQRQYSTFAEDEVRLPVSEAARNWLLNGRYRAYNYEISGDYEFPLVGGRLKLIGLERYKLAHRDESAVISFADESDPVGGRFLQDLSSGERIARAEYGWKWGQADWQIALEGAFNRLDEQGALFDLSPTGEFVAVPFPGGTGGVRESRYEGSLSYGRPLSSKVTLQLLAAAESSTISQTGANSLSRTFFRPKGTASLAWAPEKGLDISLKVERAVGQLDFDDFLARVFLDLGNQNSNNADLVPSQQWNFDLEAKKELGRWGSTNLLLFARLYDDYIDVIPLPDGGEGRGNIPNAHRYGLQWTSTFNLDPIGFRGAKIDSDIVLQTSSLIDPVTKQKRQISYLATRVVNVSLRHDIPHSNWAWGAAIESEEVTDYYRVGEFGYDNEGPVFDIWFLENKDVLGMTVKFQVINLFNARHRLYRTVYDGPRDVAPVLLREDRAQLIGPLFRLSVKGTF